MLEHCGRLSLKMNAKQSSMHVEQGPHVEGHPDTVERGEPERASA